MNFAQTPTCLAPLSLGVAIFAAVVTPTEAKTHKPAKSQIEEVIPDPVNGEPMTLIISLQHQKIDVYRGTTLLTSSAVSSGIRGFETKAGVFTILEKKRRHHSNLYSGAPMPWMQRLTWSGTALHAGVVPGFPASHGCIRLLFSFAPKLFKITTVGEHVVVAQNRLAPMLIEHENLFQSVQPPASLVTTTQEQGSKRPLDEPTEAASTNPVLNEITQVHANSASNEDTRAHAIDLMESVQEVGEQDVADVVASDPSVKARAPLSIANYPDGEMMSNALAGPRGGPLNASDAAATPPTSRQGPSVSAVKLAAGTEAAAREAAQPQSSAPLRILFTRRTLRDRVMAVQFILSDLGYLTPQAFDGTLGKATVTAVKDFQKANGLPPTGSFTDELVKKVYEIAGNHEPPIGRLFVRQEFARLFDAPVSFSNPEKPLGTHLFTALNFVPGETKTQWIGLSLEGDDPAAVLDRIKIPNDIRKKISERLTPGSSLIIGDTAINSAALPTGADFVIWAKQTPAGAAKPKAKAVDINLVKVKQPKTRTVKHAKHRQPKVKKIKQAKAKPAKAKKVIDAKSRESKAASAPLSLSPRVRSQRYSHGQNQRFDRTKPPKRWQLR